jgi:hypothetical protein
VEAAGIEPALCPSPNPCNCRDSVVPRRCRFLDNLGESSPVSTAHAQVEFPGKWADGRRGHSDSRRGHGPQGRVERRNPANGASAGARVANRYGALRTDERRRGDSSRLRPASEPRAVSRLSSGSWLSPSGSPSRGVESCRPNVSKRVMRRAASQSSSSGRRRSTARAEGLG